MRLKAKSQMVNKKLNIILESLDASSSLGEVPAPGSKPPGRLSAPLPAAALLSCTGLREIYLLLLSPSRSSFHFRASSCPLSSSNAALLSCASGTSHLFFYTFQHGVDSPNPLPFGVVFSATNAKAVDEPFSC